MPDLIRVVGVPIAIALAFLLVVFLFQRRLVYFPSPGPPFDATALAHHGSELVVSTADGLTLDATLVPACSSQPEATILVFNGNAGDRSMRLPLAEALSAAAYAVVLLDYRGYAGNPGSPSERGLLRDARALRRHVIDELGAPSDRLVYFGESLGTGVAIALAAEHPPAALVLRSPFPSLAAVGRAHYPFLPVSLLLRDRFDSLARIRRLDVPTLVVAGGADRIVPPRLSRELFDAVPGPKRWLEIPGADHNDRELLAGDRLVEAIVGFLRRSSVADL